MCGGTADAAGIFCLANFLANEAVEDLAARRVDARLTEELLSRNAAPLA